MGYSIRMRPLILAVLLLSGCVSTEMNRYVGQDISEVFMAYGRPENVFDLPDGRRAFQYRRGEGEVFVPGYSSTRISAQGNEAWVNTTSTPSARIESQGCVLTFVAVQNGNGWRVTETRVPRQLVC
jgi:hypothetical protein